MTAVTALETSELPVNAFDISWGLWGVLRLCEDPNVKTVLDIGSGPGEQARLLRLFGKEVFTTDRHTLSDYPGDFMELDFGRQFDAVLCSHVLEHQRNVGQFLDKLVSLVPEEGTIALIVPFHAASRLIVGHLTVWSAKLLVYNIIQTRIDCAQAQICQDNECTVVVRKKSFDPDTLERHAWEEKSGAAQDGVTTPWYDDPVHRDALMPYAGNAPIPLSQAEYTLNWRSTYDLPVPVEMCDLAITTRKSEKPLMLRYEHIKASFESRQAAATVREV